ncbi:MAG TPA: ABC transporter substrate-binding protein [Candidatus Binatia bacterium]|jgi:putative ABC transport system substrate-binding protein|nr:ABC transporter substrate-binding protein [Candidatus Binatia bacterium]
MQTHKSKTNNPKILTLALTFILAFFHLAEAQQTTRVHRIGFLRRAAPQAHEFEAFRQGLRDLGYVEGENIVIEQRYAHGVADRLPDLATELVQLKVEVIVVDGTTTAKGAKTVTTTIPIVFTLGDPLATGIVASYARPGGNVTGVTTVSTELSGKRLELLKEVVPNVSRVAVLFNPTNVGSPYALKETEAAAQLLALQLQILEARSTKELTSAFSAIERARSRAIMTLPDAMFFGQRERVVELAGKSRLPAMFPEKDFVDVGGLMAYGPSVSDNFRRAATYVDKILKGAKPADLPVEQPTKFELVINLKAAKQIGLTIPPNVLARADKVIK